MNVGCPSCETVYRVDPARVPAGGARTRCTHCGHVFRVEPAEPAVMTARAAPTGAPRASAQTEPVRVATPSPEPIVAAPRPSVGAPVTPATPVAPAAARTPEMPRAPAAQPTPPAPSAPPAATEAGIAARARAAVATPRSDQSTSVPGAPAAARKPVAPHPFGRRDPGERAQRLARALVSDIVAYFPDRRERALRQGTLRTEFREEIRKSWEEYVAQVGEETARKTPHFRTALNEILADGQQVF
ncbi:MAG: zinc-ribbon domain-containing protein [Gemmatimonadetes bacterium]|nr:zinc-ribbon domain-containing protein [Gemmatimonadota bacterium]